jgi:hypothetical protein
MPMVLEIRFVGRGARVYCRWQCQVEACDKDSDMTTSALSSEVRRDIKVVCQARMARRTRWCIA